MYDDALPVEDTGTTTPVDPARCRHCEFYPVSVRVPDYCSFDCFEESDDS